MTPQLALAPFSISPDPTTLYVTPAIRTTIYKTNSTIKLRQGLATILGDVGLGKSTIMRHVFGSVSASTDILATMIPTPCFKTSYGMLRKICDDFEVPMARSEQAQLDSLERWVYKQYEEGRNIVIFLDEAQRLKLETLELVRTLLNFETNKAKLVQIIMAGQLDLREKLLSKRYRALYSRIFAPSLLVPLDYDEMAAMFRARCEIAQIPWPFNGDPSVLRLMYEHTVGVPRHALKLAQLSYGLMRELDRHHIDADIVREILASTDITANEEQDQ